MICSENISPFAISGKIRKEKKKELSKLKFLLKNFWVDEDLARVYGCGNDDNTCHKMIKDHEEKIKLLEFELSKPSLEITRDNKLKELGIIDTINLLCE